MRRIISQSIDNHNNLKTNETKDMQHIHMIKCIKSQKQLETLTQFEVKGFFLY